jgi:hypothetical protein
MGRSLLRQLGQLPGQHGAGAKWPARAGLLSPNHHTDADTDPHTDTDGNPHANTDTDPHTDTDTNPHTDADGNSHAHAHGDVHSPVRVHPQPRAHG